MLTGVRKTGGSVAQRQFCRCRQNCRCVRFLQRFRSFLVFALRPTVASALRLHHATSSLFRDGDKAFWTFHFWVCEFFACHVSIVNCCRCFSRSGCVSMAVAGIRLSGRGEQMVASQRQRAGLAGLARTDSTRPLGQFSSQYSFGSIS